MTSVIFRAELPEKGPLAVTRHGSDDLCEARKAQPRRRGRPRCRASPIPSDRDRSGGVPWPEEWIPPAPSWGERLRGHKSTLGPFVERSLRPVARAATRPWQTELLDPTAGPVRLSGEFLEQPGEELLLVVHGLGGSSDSVYMGLALGAAEQSGLSCLLLNVRGADRSGHDFNHAGLAADLQAALASPELERFERIYLFGYSLGGHLVFAYASGAMDARVRRVAAIGSPLDLSASATAFDAPRVSLYRGHVMRSLHEIYTAAYQRRPIGILPVEARKITRIREWDERVIAPRFGFLGAEDYYQHVSAGPKLSGLSVPALYVGAPADPMIPLSAVLSAEPSPRLRVVWNRAAGHLGFPSDFDLGEPGPRGLEPQVLSWLRGR